MEVSGQLHTLSPQPPPREKALSIHQIGGWVGPRVSLDMVAQIKILSLPLMEIEPWSPSPQPSHYTD